MFSTLLGPLPPAGTRDIAAAVRQNIADLEATGLELLADGLPAAGPDLDPEAVAQRWRVAAQGSSRPVKQAILGPYSASRRAPHRTATTPRPGEAAGRARATLDAVVAAGCVFVEVAEPLLVATALDTRRARARFMDAHRELLDGVTDVHVSLAVTGGNLDTAGAETFFDLPYASYAFDLIAGPDNWRLIAAAPTDRGIVCGALDPRPDGDETRELLVWAGHYAASTAGRGIDRVGLANAWSLEDAPRDVALRKLRRIAEASRAAAVESAEELASLLDPRAFARRRGSRGTVRLATPDDE